MHCQPNTHVLLWRGGDGLEIQKRKDQIIILEYSVSIRVLIDVNTLILTLYQRGKKQYHFALGIKDLIIILCATVRRGGG